MKKSKLNLEKFRISSLENTRKIIGGTAAGDGGNDGGTGTGNEVKLPKKCFFGSLIYR